MTKPSSKSSPQSAFRLILGLMAAAVAGIVLIVLFVATGSPKPASSQAPTAPPPSPTAPGSPISPPPTDPAPATATATPPIKPPTSTPAPRPEVPDVAPDFTLDRAGGGTFTLQEQLEEGPVVLVFFERCG